ncbi:MAG: metallophosphoesterase [Ferruginibacter sp.]|jgi:predicted phosphodiesterase
MQKILQKIFRPFFIWLSGKFGSDPKKEAVFKSLGRLYNTITTQKKHSGIVLDINLATDNFIIFSDQHKGNKDWADDFKTNEHNYITALQYYHQQCFNFINLGDAEELWKYMPEQVIPENGEALQAEANFQADNKYYRTFGNHDLLWKSNLDVQLHLKHIFQMPLPVYEGIVLRTITESQKKLSIYLTHGHQGDKMSDNNSFSTWLVAHVWSPIQRFLEININTPANDIYLRDKHNKLMYEWSSHKRNLVLITGHTHKPVFASGKYSVAEEHQINVPETKATLRPSYFNTGCCCFNDGDITGIEIANGFIRLIKWHSDNNIPARTVLEEKKLDEIEKEL